MAEDKGSNSDYYALLIGVDCYLPHTLHDGTYYPTLSGCVPDVQRTEAFLKTRRVFATVGPASYKWLELPPLDTPLRPRGVPTNPLEALMAALTAEQLGARTMTPIVPPSHEWSTAQVEVRVKRGVQA